MKHALALLLFILASCAHGRAGHHLENSHPVRNGLDYAIALVTPNGDTYCSGAIVDHAVLTAAHCVAGAAFTPRVKWLGKIFDLEGAYVYPTQDTAILFAEGLPRGLKLAKNAPHYADTIFLVGNPLGILDMNLSIGHVTNPHRELNVGCDLFTCFPNPHMMFDAVIAPGSSGSAVLDNRGNVVGVVSFTFGPQLGGAVHLETLTAISNENELWNG